MKKIRQHVFETNSSSCHSISISNTGNLFQTLYPNDEGNIILYGDDFGWGIDTHNDVITKASYLVTHLKTISNENEDMFIKVIKEHTGAKNVIMESNGDSFYPYGYIDHQSVGEASQVFESEMTLFQYLFNPNSILHIDHDNH